MMQVSEATEVTQFALDQITVDCSELGHTQIVSMCISLSAALIDVNIWRNKLYIIALTTLLQRFISYWLEIDKTC